MEASRRTGARGARRRARIGAATAAAALVVTGCTFHPGQAAVVNGTAISESAVNDLVQAGCDYTAVLGAPRTSTAALRAYFLENLVREQIVNAAARQLGLTVSPAAVAKLRQGLGGLTGSSRTLLSGYFDQTSRMELLQATITLHRRDPAVTNPNKVDVNDPASSRLVRKSVPFLRAYAARQDVSVNPAYGTWRGWQLLPTDGSLSAAKSHQARRWLALRASDMSSVQGLPSNQTCG